MVLELHIWGPAFSLPSVDPQCIAAVAYLTQAVPRGEWRLVASGDASLSPTHDLPALKNDNVWVGGFRNIVDYIRQFSRGKWDLDAELEGRERADCIAYVAFAL
jgi:sorting and assembly machinery component 37